jgi:hypothetical protein
MIFKKYLFSFFPSAFIVVYKPRYAMCGKRGYENDHQTRLNKSDEPWERKTLPRSILPRPVNPPPNRCQPLLHQSRGQRARQRRRETGLSLPMRAFQHQRFDAANRQAIFSFLTIASELLNFQFMYLVHHAVSFVQHGKELNTFGFYVNHQHFLAQ